MAEDWLGRLRRAKMAADEAEATAVGQERSAKDARRHADRLRKAYEALAADYGMGQQELPWGEGPSKP